MSIAKTAEALREKGYEVSVFNNKEEAAEYLNAQIDGKTVGFGGSATLEEMGLGESLAKHNKVYWHWFDNGEMTEKEVFGLAGNAEIYMLSVNAVSKNGEIVNIDGNGNRLSESLYCHEKVYYVVGKNKIAADLDSAIFRARNVASPKNAHRLQVDTPCAKIGDRCYDCNSPARICRGLLVFWRKMNSCAAEVVLIDEDLGF